MTLLEFLCHFLACFLFFALVQGQATGNQSCEAEADILFIMDSSGSIGADYPTMLSFVASLTHSFNLGPNAIQVAALLFSDTANSLFNFGTYTDHSSLENAIMTAPFYAQGTQTDAALKFARLNSFTGAYGARPNIAHIAVVLTDGLSNSAADTANEAKLLKNTGVLVMTIGVGTNLNYTELSLIASSAEDQFLVNNFDILHTIASQVTNKTCQEVVTPPKQVLACDGTADVLLLISSTAAANNLYYTDLINFAINITSSYNIGPNSIQFGTIIYGDDARLYFDFQTYTDNVAMAGGLLKAPLLGDSEYVGKALNLARQQAFTPRSGARLYVPWIVIVLAEGPFTDPQEAVTESQLLRNSGVNIISVSFSNISRSQLESIATSPELVITTDTFDALEQIHTEVTNKTCKIVVAPRNYNEECNTTQQADILFILDSSTSFGLANYNLMLNFIANTTLNFNMGPNATQFAWIIFANDTYDVFDFKSNFTTYSDVVTAILNTHFLGGPTYTSKALQMAREQIFTPARGSRPGVPKVAIVFTGGQSVDRTDTLNQAKLLKSSGVLTVSVGIGSSLDQTELINIASQPDVVFQVTDVSILSVIKRQISNKTCDHVITQQTGSCDTKADILFILDSSGSIQLSDYNKMLMFISNITSNFKVGSSAVRFATIVFGDYPLEVFNFTSYTSHSTLETGILNTPYISGSTFTDKALQMARERIFGSSMGTRPNVPKIAVLLTNGQSSSPAATMTQSRLLKNAGVLLVSIGVGDNINKAELEVISSLSSDVFHAASFDVLDAIQSEFSNKTCERATDEVPVCPAVADILFVMDSTGSIGLENYFLMLNFVVNFTRNFSIGPNWAQFSVVTFGDTAHNEFGFNAYSTRAELEKGILNSAYLDETTQTDLALKMAREVSFTPQNGARSGVDKIAIVLTDGRSNDPDLTAQQAKLLKDSGVLVIAVAIGVDILNRELQTIATLPEDIFHVEHFNALEYIQKEFSKQTCDRISLTIECEAEADIMFIVDSSASIGTVNYAVMLNFLANLTRNFDLGSNAVQFGAIVFGDDAHFQFDFGQYSNHPSLEQGILGISYLAQNTFTNIALMKARLEGFTAAHGARGHVTQIAIVLTDGQSSLPTETSREAQLLKENGVLILSVGIGDTVKMSELETIASLPEDVFLVDSFNVLSTIQKSLTNKTCDKVIESQTSVCKKVTDIIFLLDSSGSISDADYQQQLLFAANFTDSFQIGPENAQFGAIIFSDTASKLFNLNDYTDHWSILQTLMKAPHLKGGTNTAQALDFIYNGGLFDAQGGGRVNATKMLIIMTDGQSANISQSVAAAQRLKSTGAQIITIGIGDIVNLGELASLASTPSDVFQADSYDVLNQLKTDVTNHTCNITRPSTSVVHRACSEMADIIFVIDSSSSISSDEYQKQLLFASNLTQEFDVGPEDARFATIVFSNDVFKVFDLDTFSDYYNLYQGLLTSPHLTGTADIGKALNWADDMQMFSLAYGGRFNASKIVVLFSNSPSSDPTAAINAAGRLKGAGVHITAIGANDYNLYELRQLASDPESVFKATSIESLDWIKNDIVDGICDYASRRL